MPDIETKPGQMDECPSGKVMYKERIEALLCIVKYELRDGHPRPVRFYECPLCGHFHVTSKKLAGEKRKEAQV